MCSLTEKTDDEAIEVTEEKVTALLKEHQRAFRLEALLVRLDSSDATGESKRVDH